jgi:hypothetical protein
MDIEDFKPINNKFRPEEQMFETFGKELEWVKDQPENKVWTLMDDDDGNLVITTGFHVVNRVGYYVTEIPWDREMTFPA